MGFTAGSVKNLHAMRVMQEIQVQFLDQENPLEEGMVPHSSILAWRIHGQRSLVGCSPLGCKEPDTTELLGTHVVGITSSSNQVVAELFCVELLKL